MNTIKYGSIIAGILLGLVFIGVLLKMISPLRPYEWAQIVFVLLSLVGTGYGIYHITTNYPAIRTQWMNGVIPIIIGFFVLHITVAWVWQDFWVKSFRQNGFILSQFVLFFGLYLMGLKTGEKKNRALVILSFLLLGIATVIMYKNTKSVLKEEPPSTKISIVVVAPVGQWSEKVPTPNWFFVKAKGPIWVKFTNGNVYETYPGNTNSFPGKTKYLEFQSQTSEPVEVTVSR